MFSTTMHTSRVKIMTGKPNYENYEYFTYLNPKEKTRNLFQDNGYKTLVAGKWQLNGVQFKLDDYTDLKRPHLVLTVICCGG